MSKHTYKLDMAGFNKEWVRSFKTLDEFLKSPLLAPTYDHLPEDKRKQMFTKVYNECAGSVPKSALAETEKEKGKK